MWARRLVGEALPRDGRVVAERATLTALIARDGRVDVPGLFGKHITARMVAPG